LRFSRRLFPRFALGMIHSPMSIKPTVVGSSQAAVGGQSLPTANRLPPTP